MGDESIIEEGTENPEGLEQSTDQGTDDVDHPETGEAGAQDEPLTDPDEKKLPESVPYSRFKEVNDKARTADELKTKFEQFKTLGSEGYYKLYPGEKPEGFEEGKQVDQTTDIQGDFSKALVEGGKYDGMEFGKVFQLDPREAYRIDPYYARKLDDLAYAAKAEQETKTRRLKEQADKEVSLFSDERANEFYGKGYAELTPKEQGEVAAIVRETLDWSDQTGRSLGNLKDAYVLKNLDKILAGEKTKHAEALFKTLTSAGAPAIQTTGGNGSNSGYDHLVSMTPAQVAAEMNSWPDDKQAEFLKNAPAKFREKYPRLPYPD